MTPGLRGIAAAAVFAALPCASNAWDTTIHAGLSLTEGNSETRSVHGGAAVEGTRRGLGLIRASVDAAYTETTADGQTDETVNQVTAAGEARKDLDDTWYAYGRVDALYDPIAEIDYRITAGPGLGGYLARSETRSLSADAGVAWVEERVDDREDGYAAGRLAQRWERALRQSAKLWQTLEYMPRLDEFEDYLLQAEVGVEAAVNETLNLRVVLKNRYDNRPADGVERNDLALQAGLSLRI